MTKKLTTSLFAIAAITAAGFGFNSLNNETPSELAKAPITQNTEEQQIAFDPISRGESCWIRDYEPVPCPSDSWNAEELNAFDAEEQIAFDHRPCHQKRPGYSWGYGIFGTTCSRRAGEELNAFEAEELIVWEQTTKCYKKRDRKEEVPCPFNTEELNAFDAEDLTV